MAAVASRRALLSLLTEWDEELTNFSSQTVRPPDRRCVESAVRQPSCILAIFSFMITKNPPTQTGKNPEMAYDHRVSGSSSSSATAVDRESGFGPGQRFCTTCTHSLERNAGYGPKRCP